MAKVLTSGLNPAAEKKKGKDQTKLQAQRLTALKNSTTSTKPQWPENSFGAIHDEWFIQWSRKKSPDYVGQMRSRLDGDILPMLGSLLITEIEAPDIVKMALEIENSGAEELARHALFTTGQIFRFAIAHGYARRNPAAYFKPGDVLKDQTVTNHPRIVRQELQALLLAMANDTGTETTRCAIWIMARTFVKTTELRETPWAELDLDDGWWEISKERMKMNSPHIVPLSRQVVGAFRELREITGDSEHVFHGAIDREKCMSNNTILGALKRMGHHGVMTGHGYRGLASTILHEGALASALLQVDGYPDTWIELQLAHMPRNKFSAAYNYAQYLDGRKRMMQDWSDYLDEQLNKVKKVA